MEKRVAAEPALKQELDDPAPRHSDFLLQSPFRGQRSGFYPLKRAGRRGEEATWALGVAAGSDAAFAIDWPEALAKFFHSERARVVLQVTAMVARNGGVNWK